MIYVMEFIEKIYPGFQNFLSFLTGGSFCLCCGTKTYAIPLCKNCQSRVKKIESFSSSKRCKKCGKILVSEIELCSECRKKTEKSSLDFIFPVTMYRLWLKDLLYAWKTENQRTLSPFFAKIIYNALQMIKTEFGFEFDGIVPVPMRPGKLKVKGWDQIDELCRILKKKHKIKILPVLERLTTIEQKTLNREQRRNFSGSAYALKKNVQLNGKSFLILDDVITTGSTMEKCAGVLKKNGAEQVCALSLFMVD